jgi:hypothetical protein
VAGLFISVTPQKQSLGLFSLPQSMFTVRHKAALRSLLMILQTIMLWLHCHYPLHLSIWDNNESLAQVTIGLSVLTFDSQDQFSLYVRNRILLEVSFFIANYFVLSISTLCRHKDWLQIRRLSVPDPPLTAKGIKVSIHFTTKDGRIICKSWCHKCPNTISLCDVLPPNSQ